MDREPKSLKKYLKRQDKQTERTLRSYQKAYKNHSPYQGTKTLFIMIIIFSIAALVFDYYRLSDYFSLSLHGLIYKFTYYTFFTSLFVSSGDLISLFFLFIMLFILYFMARNIEMSFGVKFLIRLYVVCCLFTALFYILLRIALISVRPLTEPPIDSIGLAFGGILGLLAYSLFPIMNRKITAFMYFLPIRMSGRSFLILIIVLRIFPVLIFAWSDPLYIVFYLPELGGILASYIIYKYQFSARQRLN